MSPEGVTADEAGGAADVWDFTPTFTCVNVPSAAQKIAMRAHGYDLDHNWTNGEAP